MGLVALTFDVEELRALDHYSIVKNPIRFDETVRGIRCILDTLPESVPCTAFTTLTFASNHPQSIRLLIDRGWEIASHGLVDLPQTDDITLSESKKGLESLFGINIQGFRAPLMAWTPELCSRLAQHGYLYDSSLHPTWVPTRYRHLRKPRDPYTDSGIIEYPATVFSPLRIPVSWWWTRNISPKLVLAAARTNDITIIYYHPWEFVELDPEFPFTVRRRTGEWMRRALRWIVDTLKKDGHRFVRLNDGIELDSTSTQRIRLA